MVEGLTAIGADSELGAGSLEGIFEGVLWEWREGKTKTSVRATTVVHCSVARREKYDHVLCAPAYPKTTFYRG